MRYTFTVFRFTLLIILGLFTSLMANSQDLKLVFAPEMSLNFNSYITFQVELNQNETTRSTYAKKRKERLAWSHLDIKITGGDYLKQGILKIHSSEKLKEKGEITLEVAYKDQRISKTLELTFDEIQIVDFNGKKAKKTRSNSFFRQLGRSFVNQMLSEATGVEITTMPRPKDGRSGKKGGHAGLIHVGLDTLYINNTLILKATCVDKTYHKKAVAYINPLKSQIKIMAEGGDGGHGTHGEAFDPNYHGGSSNNNGIGGKGGRAGAGGQVEVYTNSATTPYIHALIVSTNGGLGGFSGQSARRHPQLTDGINGDHGQVVFINKEDNKQ